MTGAQWTGIVTSIAIEMLNSDMVDAVICVQRYNFLFLTGSLSDNVKNSSMIDLHYFYHSDPDDRFTPRPVLAKCISLKCFVQILNFF